MRYDSAAAFRSALEQNVLRAAMPETAASLSRKAVIFDRLLATVTHGDAEREPPNFLAVPFAS